MRIYWKKKCFFFYLLNNNSYISGWCGSWSTLLCTKGWRVWLLVRAHIWVIMGSIPNRVVCWRQRINATPPLSLSPHFLSLKYQFHKTSGGKEKERKRERGRGKRKKEKRREGGREEYLVMGYGYLLSMYRSQVLESELTLPLLFFISCWCSYSIFFCHNSSNPVSQRCSTFKRNKESSNGSTLRYWCLIDMRICCVFLHN